MHVGKKKDIPENWNLGEESIGITTNYKYLGDVITSDGKNEKNIIARENMVNGIVRSINTTASSDVMRGIETNVILNLYNTKIIPCLLNNAESWTLSTKEEKQLDTIGIRTIKRLFGLPTRSPNVSIVYSFGLLYITQEVDKKQFLYLQKLLYRPETEWYRRMLMYLKSQNSGWAKHISDKLIEYELETDWEMIKRKTVNEWKNEVYKAVLRRNGKKLIDNCVSISNGIEKVHTKTRHIYQKLNNELYNAAPIKRIIVHDKQRARTVFMAQNGMLECGMNMKGTIPETCSECNVPDNEQHRLVECRKWLDSNAGNPVDINFCDIHNDDLDERIFDNLVKKIESIWETRYANGRMKR